ncbi:MAG: ubiquinol-cytochrome c reductase iron-sulfur subunit, partial [Mycobacteriales bacterium]
GFGSRISLGTLDDVKAAIAAEPGGLLKLAEARTWLIAYDGNGADSVYKGAVAGGLLASYWKCAHLGCTVPRCDASHWLECPCHGSRYNKAGEYQFGPAPRGLDHFPVTIEGDKVVVDTATRLPGPTRGTDTIHQAPAGPHCNG